MKNLNRNRRLAVLTLALALAAMPAMAAPTPTDILDLHQQWLDRTDNFLADVFFVAVEGKNESLVAKWQLLSEQNSGNIWVIRRPCQGCCDFAPFQAERQNGLARAGVAGIGFSDIALTSGPFTNGSWDLFARGSTAAQTLDRLGVIAHDVRAVRGSGVLTGLEGLVISLDQGFKRSYQGIVEQALGGELISDPAWNRPQQLELWFDAEDGRIHQISSTTKGVRSDLLFDYIAVDLAPADLAETRESLAIRTSDQSAFSSLLRLMDVLRAGKLPAATLSAGLPLFAGILLLLVGRTFHRMRDLS